MSKLQMSIFSCKLNGIIQRTKCCRISLKSVVHFRIIGVDVDENFYCRMQKNIIFVVDSTFSWTPIAPSPLPKKICKKKLATDLRGVKLSIIWGIFFWFNFNLYIKVVQKTTFLRLGHTSLFYQKWHLVVAPAISIRYQSQKKILDLKKFSKKIRKKSLILTVYNTWVKDFRKWDKNVKISYF